MQLPLPSLSCQLASPLYPQDRHTLTMGTPVRKGSFLQEFKYHLTRTKTGLPQVTHELETAWNCYRPSKGGDSLPAFYITAHFSLLP